MDRAEVLSKDCRAVLKLRHMNYWTGVTPSACIAHDGCGSNPACAGAGGSGLRTLPGNSLRTTT
jgi:hypothetical protein